jgi:hypothetical protein
MELVRSPKFIWAPAYSWTHWLRPRNSNPPPAFGLIYEGAIGQPRSTTSLCNPLALAFYLPFLRAVDRICRRGAEYVEPVEKIYWKRPTLFSVVLVSSNPSLLSYQSSSVLVFLLCFVAVNALACAMRAIGTGAFRNYSDEKGYMVEGLFYYIL